MTKIKYISLNPTSLLSSRLVANDWPDDTEVQIIEGLDSPYQPQSRLHRALEASNMKEYVIGEARTGSRRGWVIAVA